MRELSSLTNNVLNYEALEGLQLIPDKSVDLVIMSPPMTFKGLDDYDYYDYIIPVFERCSEILKPSGSLLFNLPMIQEAKKGTNLEVYALLLALCDSNMFNLIDTLPWLREGLRRERKGLFKDGFENIYHLSTGTRKTITFNPLVFGEMRVDPETKKIVKEKPTNVLNFTAGLTKHNPGEKLPETLLRFMVESYTNEGDIVVEPFAYHSHSGHVCMAARRKFILIEEEESICNIQKEALVQNNDMFSQTNFVEI